jgi:ABC-type sugar transport system ATPase subunit
VATFVGSPPMNLFGGRLEGTTPLPTFRGTFDMAVDPLPRGTAGDAPVTLGIRPEHIALVASGTPGALPGVVELVENVGADSYLSVSVGGETAWVRTSAQTPVVEGEGVSLVFDPDHIRWFDEAGLSLRQEVP